MRAPSIILLVCIVAAGCVSPPPLLEGQVLAPACPDGPRTQPFEHRDIGEVSGLARSGHEPCLFWAHDDSGSEPILYGTDARGHHLGLLRLDAPAVDWEDIASFTLDDTPYLLVADIGNNFGTRATVTFLVLREPDVRGEIVPFERRAQPQAITVRYPHGPFNAESVAVDPASDEILLVSKGTGPDQSLFAANLSRALREGVAILEPRAQLTAIVAGTGSASSQGAATAMDLRPDRGALALLTYREVLVWPRAAGQSWAEAVQGTPLTAPVPREGADQMEALAWSSDGTWLLVGAEKGRPNSMLSVLAAP